ncbi:MAG: hypothetical protein HYZ54_00800, partial [Ignavibacteriae bacterium]|nr:hypothetical protein [Ignavibacteriota bacterium]
MKKYRLKSSFLIAVLFFSVIVASAQITGLTPVDSLDCNYLNEVLHTEPYLDSSLLSVGNTEDSTTLPNSEFPQAAKDTITPSISSMTEPHTLGAFDMFTNLPGDWFRWSKQTFTIDNIP